MEDRTIRFQENQNVEVNLEAGRSAFPLPMFEWTQNGQPAMNGSGRVFGYPSLTISSVARTDSGMYTLSARNFELGTTDEIGNDTVNFTLDILCKSRSSLVSNCVISEACGYENLFSLLCKPQLVRR